MRHITVDGKDMMLNVRESAWWIKTGYFEHIPEGDSEDPEYCALREKMKANGDEEFYKQCCPDHPRFIRQLKP